MRRALAGLVALGLLTGCQAPPRTTAEWLDERRAAGIQDCPHLSGTAVDGGMPGLALECLGADSTVPLAGLRGPLLVLFWAQWCEPCRQEMPMLGRVLPTYGDRLQVLLVTTKEPRYDYAIEFAHDTGVLAPQVVDADASALKAMGMSSGLPQSVLVDAGGRIVSRHAGGWTEEALRREVSEKLGVQG